MNIYFIPDTQVKPDVRHSLSVVAWDIIFTLPDVVVLAGDHHDYTALYNWDKGKHSFNNRCYVADTKAGNDAFRDFWIIIQKGYNANPNWKCRFIFIRGNHEDRRTKAIDLGPKEYLELLNLVQPDYNNWDVVMPFLKPIEINGVSFVHYIANDFTGKAIGTARLALSRKHKSFVVGHKQTLDYAEETTLSGKRIQGLIIGACYFHDEKYKGPQGNSHFRGTAYLRNVLDGEFEMEIRNLKTLDKKYGQNKS